MANRFPGKYIVFGILAVAAVTVAILFAVADRLTPAAGRFHDGPAATGR